MTVLFVMILMAENCPNTHAATINLKCGQKVRDNKSGNYFQAPACPKPCLARKTSVVGLAPTPTPILLPAPIPAPVSAPVPSPSPAPASGNTIDFACTTYWNYGHRDSAGTAVMSKVNKLRSYCDMVLTWWESTPSQTWCPYIRHNSAVKFCGPYDNWGYMRTDKELYKKHGVKWQLKTDSGSPTLNQYIPLEGALDWGNPAFVHFFIDYFNQPPAGISEWTGTFRERSWNLRELDNFVIRTINNYAWNNTPVNPRTGKAMTNAEREADVLRAMQTMRAAADAQGLKYFANVFSDLSTDYFSRPVYSQLMNLVDYAFFEVMVADMQHNNVTESVWLTRVKIAQAIAKNNRAIPVITTEYGDFWYNVATMLLACEPGKCMTFQQPIMTDSQIEKLSTLDLGAPVSDFAKAGCYIRSWTKGLIAVNPMDSGSCHVALSGSYRDLETGKTVSGTIQINNKGGKVLVEE